MHLEYSFSRLLGPRPRNIHRPERSEFSAVRETVYEFPRVRLSDERENESFNAQRSPCTLGK